MFIFPQNVYADVRIEEVFEANTHIKNGDLKENKQRRYKGAFIRVFDGKRWYYSSTTNLAGINDELEKLAQMATPNEAITEHPTVKRLEVHQEQLLKYQVSGIHTLSKKEQEAMITPYEQTVKAYEEVKEYGLYYIGKYTKKSFYSSKGAEIIYDNQTCAVVVGYALNVDGKRFNNAYDKTTTDLSELTTLHKQVDESIKESISYIKTAVPVTPGKYTVVFCPMATGIFAHESFGHKSEADLMLGSETMKEEWKIGKQVGCEALSIIDRGDFEGSGYVPFDDEGNKARVNYLIKDGYLAGRLHTGSTATILDEEVTGNGRSMNFEYEPIVRMTTTYVDKGTMTKDELFAGIKEGIYVADVSHGSGLSAFTIAPKIAYMIRDGKVAEAVTVSVVTGNVMETLYLIDGISDTVEFLSFSRGGCGKMEQYPLPVGFGGPYIRVQNLDVQ